MHSLTVAIYSVSFRRIVCACVGVYVLEYVCMYLCMYVRTSPVHYGSAKYKMGFSYEKKNKKTVFFVSIEVCQHLLIGKN